jgi:hypothetical protein
MTAFWDIALYSLIEVGRCFRGTYFLHHQGDHHPDEGSTHFWNVGQFLLEYTAQHPRRLSSSFSPPWEPEISLLACFNWIWYMPLNEIERWLWMMNREGFRRSKSWEILNYCPRIETRVLRKITGDVSKDRRLQHITGTALLLINL